MEERLLESDLEGGALEPGAQGLGDVPNLRDVAGVDGLRVRGGLLYRCSMLFDAKTVRALRVVSLLDLRQDDREPVVAEDVATRVVLPLVDRPTGTAILRSLPWTVKLKLACLWPCLGFKAQIGRYILSGVDEMTCFYMTLLTHGTEPIKGCFEHLASEANYPCIVHCVAGKDRTGIVVALLLRLLGVPHDAVVRDYAASEHFLSLALRNAGTVEIADESLLNHETIISPPEVMDACLRSLEAKHGSVEQYLLDYVGVDASTLTEIRRIFVATPA